MRLTEKDRYPHRLGYGDTSTIHVRYLRKNDLFMVNFTVYKALIHPTQSKSGLWFIDAVAVPYSVMEQAGML